MPRPGFQSRRSNMLTVRGANVQDVPVSHAAKALFQELTARGCFSQWTAKNGTWQASFFTSPAQHGPSSRYLLTVIDPRNCTDSTGRKADTRPGHINPFESPDAIANYPFVCASVVSVDKCHVFRPGIALILDAPPECVVATCPVDMHSGNYVNGSWQQNPAAIQGAATLFQRRGVDPPAELLAATDDTYNEVLLLGRYGASTGLRATGVAIIQDASTEQETDLVKVANAVATGLGVPCVQLQSTPNNPHSLALLEHFVPPPELQDDLSLWSMARGL